MDHQFLYDFPYEYQRVQPFWWVWEKKGKPEKAFPGFEESQFPIDFPYEYGRIQQTLNGFGRKRKIEARTKPPPARAELARTEFAVE